MAGAVAPHIGDDDDPTRGGEEDRLSITASAARIEVNAGEEDNREDAIDHMEQVARLEAGDKGQSTRQTLHDGETNQHQIGGAKAAAHRAAAQILVRAPDTERDREENQGEGKPDVKESRKRRHQVSLVEARSGQRSPSRPPTATTNRPADPATQPAASNAEWRRARRRLLSYLRTRVERGRIVGSLCLVN